MHLNYPLCIFPFIVEQCCDQLFLSANGSLAENQEGVLGIYNYTDIDEHGRPYYTKDLYGTKFYLYYKVSQGKKNLLIDIGAMRRQEGKVHF